MDWRNVRGVGDAVSYTAGNVARNLPQMAPVLAGGLAGAAVGAATGLGVGAIPGFIFGAAGGFLANYPLHYGNHRERQRQAQLDKGVKPEDIKVDEAKAASTAVVSATLDTVADRLLLGKLIPGGGEISGKVLGRIDEGVCSRRC
jgi:hypothetical protein